MKAGVICAEIHALAADELVDCVLLHMCRTLGARDRRGWR